MLDVIAVEKRHASRSEAELQTVLTSVDAVIYALSGDGVALLYLSPGAGKFYGREMLHFVSDPALRHASVLEDDLPHIAELARQLSEGDHGDVEYRIRRGDGSVRWLREQCHLLRDADGAPWRRTGVISDVSDSRQLVEALVESEARFRALTMLSSDWYWEQDETFRFTRLTTSPKSSSQLRNQTEYVGKRRWELATTGLDEAEWTAHAGVWPDRGRRALAIPERQR
jgi:PAS domain S-box-containing protein